MKWFDIKKYKPPQNTYLIFRMTNDENEEHICCGSYDHDGEVVVLHLDYFSSISMTITHFCIPDPIEINKEKS